MIITIGYAVAYGVGLLVLLAVGGNVLALAKAIEAEAAARQDHDRQEQALAVSQHEIIMTAQAVQQRALEEQQTRLAEERAFRSKQEAHMAVCEERYLKRIGAEAPISLATH